MNTDLPPAVIGIDPGLDGAIALYRPFHHLPGMRLVVWPMPTTTSRTTRKRSVCARTLHATLTMAQEAITDGCCWSDRATQVYLENVHASPQMGVTSAFSFGRSFGVTQGTLVPFGFEVILVEPQVWKHATGTPREKNAARARAAALFPDAAYQWARAKDDGIAEAALIAWYGANVAVSATPKRK